jgi:hypothetical protein
VFEATFGPEAWARVYQVPADYIARFPRGRHIDEPADWAAIQRGEWTDVVPPPPVARIDVDTFLRDIAWQDAAEREDTCLLVCSGELVLTDDGRDLPRERWPLIVRQVCDGDTAPPPEADDPESDGEWFARRESIGERWDKLQREARVVLKTAETSMRNAPKHIPSPPRR